MNESVFDIAGPDGTVLRALLTRPAPGDVQAAPGAPVVVLLPSGFKYRVGSHRLNVLLARHLATLGFRTLRFDPGGFGESDGSLAVVPYGMLGVRLEEGYFVADVLRAVGAVHDRLGARVVLGGLCAGGVSATLAAARDTDGRVAGVLSIGLPVLTLGHPDVRRMPRPEIARRRLRNYLQKLVSPAAWLRVLRGHSDFGHIGRNVRAALQLPRWGATTAAPPAQENPFLLQSFHALQQRGVPQLFVFGTSDNRWIEFEQTFFDSVLGGQRRGPGFQVDLVDEASHELHFEPAKRATLDAVGQWLQRLPAAVPR